MRLLRARAVRPFAQPRGLRAVASVLMACVAVALAPPRAIAQPVSRLGDVLTRAMRGNARIVAADALSRAARARVSSASRPPDPQLQLGFMNYGIPSLAPMATLGMTQLQLMQMVPLGGKLRLGARVAGARASATGERAHAVATEVRSEAAIAFYDLYASDRQLDIARETLRLLQDVARTAESMYRVGQGRQADVLRAQVEIARMIQDTVRMHAMRLGTLARLDALVHGGDDRLVVTPALPSFPEVVPERAWLDSVAFATRPAILAAIEDLHAADASATLARRELVPDLQVGVQYAQRSATMPAADAVGPAIPERSTERMGSLMIGASIPIFARSRQLAMRTEANAMKAMAAAEVAAMRAETSGRIGGTRAVLEQARTLASYYRTTILPQARAMVASASSAYRAGQVDFMTLLDDEMAVKKYRQELSTLEADEGKAWAELEMLTGRELIDADSEVAAPPRTIASDVPGTMGAVR
jgi:outer membrane protein, heavy metal efflux system